MDATVKFYSSLHKEEPTYGGTVYRINDLLSISGLRRWLHAKPNPSMKIADIGCGKGHFLRDLTNTLKTRFDIKCDEVVGLDLYKSPDDVFKEIPAFAFIQHDIDGKTLPFEDGYFDFVSCNHVMEHIFETEKLARELKRILSPTGIAMVAVPNIAAWINRILFLFAGQPLGTEVGTETVSYGFWPRIGQRHLAPIHPAGHIRDFTPRALEDLTAKCGLQTIGWWNHDPMKIMRISKWSGRNMAVILKHAPSMRS